jgi:MFS superfamily sulfate permease-like transporter
MDGTSHHLAALLGVLTIVTLVAWKALAPKRWQLVPAPLVAVCLATSVAAAFGMADAGVRCISLPARLTDAIRPPTWDVIESAWSWSLVGAAASVALVASAETLLCAAAVDQMHTGPRTRYDRELAAQGVGNILCGFLGALPMTGVIVRSSANVEAGARTRLSAILHGAWLLAFVVLLPFVLELIPTSSLAAILVYTGWKLINPKAIRALYRYGWGEVLICLVTLGTIVATSLLKGILVGIALSLAKLLYTFSHLRVRLDAAPGQDRVVLHLEGAATFIRLPRLAAALETVPPASELHVHLEGLSYIDHACLNLLMNWEKQHASTGGSLVVDWESLTARFRPTAADNGNNNGRGGGDRPAELTMRSDTARSA